MAPPGSPLAAAAAAALLLLLLLLLHASPASTQDPLVVLRQGTLRGIRVFTETRQPIMAFLGVPYAAPPVGELRFAAPERHAGWNGSLFAGSWRAACPQPLAASAAAGPALTDEDCLTLNVWTPDLPHYRPLPVVVLVEGEGFVTGAPQRFPGHDLAAEGLVVVSASYRLNVFGFFALGDAAARGNLGLLDQYVALLWVRENIALFRGDPNAVTLMGHGAGAAAAAMHLSSPRTAGLFQRAVLMSGSCASPWTRARPVAQVAAASRGLARKLGCAPPDDSARLLACLRAKPAAELLRAFEAQYQNGNWSELVGPVVDDFLAEEAVYLGRDPLDALAAGGSPVPVLTGVTSAEGTATLHEWGELARQGGAALRQFLEQTALPHALRRYGLLPEPGAGAGPGSGPGEAAVQALASWRYAEVAGAAEGDAAALRSALLQLFADTRVLAPHRRQLRLLAAGQQPVFAYAFTQPAAPDPFAPPPGQQQPPLNLSGGGAPHGSELLFLLGPTALVQATRQRPAPGEERLAKSLKRLWAEFAHRGPNNYVCGVSTSRPIVPKRADGRRVRLRAGVAALRRLGRRVGRPAGGAGARAAGPCVGARDGGGGARGGRLLELAAAAHARPRGGGGCGRGRRHRRPPAPPRHHCRRSAALPERHVHAGGLRGGAAGAAGGVRRAAEAARAGAADGPLLTGRGRRRGRGRGGDQRSQGGARGRQRGHALHRPRRRP